MKAIEEIKTELERCPHVKYAINGNQVSVEPEDDSGFTLVFVDDSDEYVVHFDGWHEHFTDMKEAIDCFGFGLTAACRLAVLYRGATPVRWTLEVFEDGAWIPYSTTGLVFTPFWRRKRVAYLQNRFVSANRS